MLILVDLDDVLADFEGYFLSVWKEKFPKRPFVPLNERTVFGLVSEYKSKFGNTISPEKIEKDISTIFNTSGFARRIPPKEAGLEAIKEMKQMGHDVYICSCPITETPHNAKDKMEWIKYYLGCEWTARTILTKDKTLIRGDILIDDKPTIEGVYVPEWEQVILDMPYNLDVTGKKRIGNDWSDWRKILNL